MLASMEREVERDDRDRECTVIVDGVGFLMLCQNLSTFSLFVNVVQVAPEALESVGFCGWGHRNLKRPRTRHPGDGDERVRDEKRTGTRTKERENNRREKPPKEEK